MLIGYARVSTSGQELDMQIDALTEAGASTIYKEQESGKSITRPELQACIKALRKGDVLIVWRLDRLGRSLKDLIQTVENLQKAGVSFRSLKENLDTTSPTGKLIFHVIAALAQFERDLIQDRTMAGLAAARARGKKGGRPRKLSKEKIQLALVMMSQRQTPVNEIANVLGVSRATLYRLQRRKQS